MLIVLGGYSARGHLNQNKSPMSHKNLTKYVHLTEEMAYIVTERGT